MGRAGGKSAGGEPDWLGPKDQGEGAPANRAEARQVQKEEKKKRPRRYKDDEDLDKPEKKGFKPAPLILLILLVLPAALPTIIDVFSKLDKLGVIKIPNFYGSDSHYRPCLQEYYADWAPEKLGMLDDTLIKWEGKERSLFAKLNKKYKKQVNVAKCPAPPKAQS